MQVKLISLKNSGFKQFVIDEAFWEKVKYVVFHSERIEFRLKKGRSPIYLHNWFYEVLHDSSQNYSEEHRQNIYKEMRCSYRFPKDNDEVVDHLYSEAKNRGLLRRLH